MRFSERYGHKTARETIQIDSINTELRNSLWSLLKVHVWDPYSTSGPYLSSSQNQRLSELCRALWFSYFKLPLDMMGNEWRVVRQELREYFFTCEWYEVYDFIEFVAQKFPYGRPEGFIGASNDVLKRELSAYRFVGNTITPITDKGEIESIDEALAGSGGPVRAHLNRALELLSDRTSPDYRNSIKESISAVESLVATTVGEKGTLGQLIKKLEDEIDLHPALVKTFGTLYGYTSDADGIRHALMDLPTVTFDDAKFFLVVCSAFVNFVQSRVAATVPAKPATP